MQMMKSVNSDYSSKNSGGEEAKLETLTLPTQGQSFGPTPFKQTGATFKPALDRIDVKKRIGSNIET